MIKVEIEKPAVKRSGTSAKGRPYEIKEQEAYFHLPGAKYPVKSTIRLGDDVPDQGYAPGMYDVDLGKSIEVETFGPKWGFRTVLIPAPGARR